MAQRPERRLGAASIGWVAMAGFVDVESALPPRSHSSGDDRLVLVWFKGNPGI